MIVSNYLNKYIKLLFFFYFLKNYLKITYCFLSTSICPFW